MRNVTPDQLAAMVSQNTKPVSHVVFRDVQARWTLKHSYTLTNYSQSQPYGVAPYAAVDSCYYNGYIYKVWRDNNVPYGLRWLKVNVDTLASTTGSYSVGSHSGYNIQRMSLVNNQVYYMYDDGTHNYIYGYDIDTATNTKVSSAVYWPQKVSLAVTDATSPNGRRHYVFGPVSIVGGDSYRFTIQCESGTGTGYETRMTLLSFIVDKEFMYSGNVTWFDAATSEDGSYDVVIFNSVDGGSPKAMIVDIDADGTLVGKSGVWPIIPADIVDNYTFFRLGWLKRIGDTFYATGRAGRGGSTGLHAQSWDVVVRSKDGIHWTMDRYQYLSEDIGHGPVMAHTTADRMFLMVVGDLYESPQNYLFGGDPAVSKITATAGIRSWNYNKGLNAVDSGSITLDNTNKDYDGLRPGWWAFLYGGFNDEELLLATMSIDTIDTSFASGQDRCSLRLRGTAMKSLADWASDQDWQWLSGIRHYEDCDNIGGLYTINGEALSAPPDEPAVVYSEDGMMSNPAFLEYDDVGVHYNKARGISLDLTTVGKITGDHYVSADFCDYGQLALCAGSDGSADIPPGSSCGVLTNVIDKDNFWVSAYNFHDITHKLWQVKAGVWSNKKDITVPSAAVTWRNNHKDGVDGDPYARVYYNLGGQYITTGIILGPDQLETTRDYGDVDRGTDQITRESLFVGDILATGDTFDSGKVGVMLANDMPTADIYIAKHLWRQGMTGEDNKLQDGYMRSLHDWTKPSGGYDDETHVLSAAEKVRTSLSRLVSGTRLRIDDESVNLYNVPPDDRSGCYKVSAVTETEVQSPQRHTQSGGGEDWAASYYIAYILTGKSQGCSCVFQASEWVDSPSPGYTRFYDTGSAAPDFRDVFDVDDKFVMLPWPNIDRPNRTDAAGYQTIEMRTDGIGVGDVIVYEHEQEYNLDFVAKDLAAKAGVLDVCGAATDDDTDTTYSQQVHINDGLVKTHEFRAIDETAHVNWDANVTWDVVMHNAARGTQRNLMFAFLRQKHDAKLLTTDLLPGAIGMIVDVVIDTLPSPVAWHMYLYDTYAADGPILRDYTTGTLTNASLKNPADVRVVKRGRHVSVYFNNSYLGSVTSRPISSVYAAEATGHVYHDEVWNGSSYLHVGSIHDVLATVKILELNDYVDNLILDQRMSAQAGMSRLFQDKRIYLSATPDETLRISRFTTRDTTETAGDLFLANDRVLRDRVPTHVRAIGEEVSDYIDHTAAAERGVLFMSINTPTLEEEEAYQEARRLVLDAAGEADTMNPNMAGRLHWEPGDKLPISYTDLKGTVVADDYLIVGLNTTHNLTGLTTQARVRRLVT